MNELNLDQLIDGLKEALRIAQTIRELQEALAGLTQKIDLVEEIFGATEADLAEVDQ